MTNPFNVYIRLGYTIGLQHKIIPDPNLLLTYSNKGLNPLSLRKSKKN